MAGLVPAIPTRAVQCSSKRDARDKRGHDKLRGVGLRAVVALDDDEVELGLALT
jgi:hypothetical protein